MDKRMAIGCILHSNAAATDQFRNLYKRLQTFLRLLRLKQNKMICLSIPLILLGLLCLVGRSGHMVGADQLLITDHIIVSVQQAAVPAAPLSSTSQMDALPLGSMETAHDSIDVGDMVVTELHRSLRFEPPKLDFGAWSIGTARSHTVTLVNQNQNRSVYLSSVSGKTPAFYSSFFEAKVVPPQGNTTFNVVFLPRSNGAIATSLLIHTSFGQAKLMVKGEGRECPYRLKPMLGVKAPLNATLTPEILMYNPHNHPLQILEIYSSGGQFQLELPSGGQEGPQALWEIPPFATKPVIRIRFNSNQAGNYSAYIRIKIAEHINESLHSTENVLVIPVEFETLAKDGIYAENPVIDFRRLTTNDRVKQQKIILRHSLSVHDRKMHNVVDYSLRELPGLTFNKKDATIALDPQQFQEDTSIEELLIIRAATNGININQTQEFSLLIRAEVFKGGLVYDKNTTIFVTQTNFFVAQKPRSLLVTNQFTLPLAILNVTLEQNSSHVFQMIVNHTAIAEILQPDDSKDILQLQLLDEHQTLRTTLHIHTNITTISIPVVVCAGTLHVQTFAGTQFAPTLGKYNTALNLGIVPFAEISDSGYVVLYNKNPLNIKLESWDFQTPQGIHFHTTFLGCLRGTELKTARANGTLTLEHSKYKFCTYLGEYDVAAYQIAIKSYKTEDNTASLKIWTLYESINSEVSYKTWIGKLEVDQEQLYFKNCFPGKLCSSDLSIRSTFLKPMRINSINFTDLGLTFKDFNADGTWIAPEATTKVGRIYFEPSRLCAQRCYIPSEYDKSNIVVFPEVKSTAHAAGSANSFFDETELRRRTEIYRHLKWYFQTISFTLNSNEIRQFQLHLIIDIEWPKLVSGKQRLPTIEVGKKQTVQVVLTNPANTPILVDYFLADAKLSKETDLSLPLEVVDICTNCYLTDKEVFSLPDGAPRKPILLQAETSMAVNVQFSAEEADTYSTLLHVRNNLTLYEAVWLSAKTVQSQFKFGNRKPGSSTPLLFEVNEKHLSACTSNDSDQVRSEQLVVITKRTFTARNTGEIPIWIETFLIGDQMCEGFGFKVLDCSSFVLQANASKKIEIAFSPDFTSARVSRPLRLITNLSYDVSYALVAIMPPLCLDLCSELLPRPHWELQYKIATLIVVGTSFVLVMLAAYIDYGNLMMKQSVLYLVRDKGPVQPTFNLRNIVIKTQTPRDAVAEQNAAAAQPAIKPNKQQVNKNNGNSCSLRKRVVKKINANGNNNGRNMSLSDITWPLELNTLKKEERPEKSPKSMQQTFSERCFKLKLEGDKSQSGGQSPSNSSSSISSSECSTKSTSPPKVSTNATQAEKDAAASTVAAAATQNKKQKQLKKSKRPTSITLSEPMPNGKEVERSNSVPSKPSTNRSPKQAAKAESELNVSSTKSSKQVTESVKSVTEPILETPPPVVLNKATNNSSSNEVNGGVGRKYGKTPGRERRKDSSNAAATTDATHTSGTKRSERKQRSKAANALNFNSSPSSVAGETAESTTTYNSISSPWDTSSQVVSFSHVLQSSQQPVNNDESTNLVDKIGNHTNNNALQKEINYTNDAKPSVMLKNDLKQNISNAYNKKLENSIELGPIGSKKSPSSTPVWEPMIGTSVNAPQLPKPTTLSNNSSFFSNLLPSYTYSDNQSDQYIGLTPSALFEMKKAQEELQRQWQTNEYLFNLRQQQMLAQQQLQAMEATNNWTLNAQTWTPMGYGQSAVSNSGPTANNNNTGSSMSLGPWQRTAAMRPPPGLEQTFQTNSMSSAQHAESQQSRVIDGDGSTTANTGVDNMQQPMQTFDPFSSLSSIWSENWNKNNNHNDMK